MALKNEGTKWQQIFTPKPLIPTMPLQMLFYLPANHLLLCLGLLPGKSACLLRHCPIGPFWRMSLISTPKSS